MSRVIVVDLRVELEFEESDLASDSYADALEFARESHRDIARLCTADDFEIVDVKMEVRS